MTDENGGTVGFWVPEDSDVVDEFDRVVCDGEPRSKQIREALKLLTAVEETLDDAGYDLSDRERRMWVKQALLDQLRRERSQE